MGKPWGRGAPADKQRGKRWTLLVQIVVGVTILGCLIAAGVNGVSVLNSPWYRPEWKRDQTLYRKELATATEDCKLYVMDAAVEIAPRLGLPVCKMDDEKFWPHMQAGMGIQSMDRTPHWAHQHGGGHWLAQAMLNSSVRTENLREADIIFLDMHCYHSWFISHLRRGGDLDQDDSPKHVMVRALRELFERPEFLRGTGAHLALYLPIPASLTVYGQFLERELRAAAMLVLESGFMGRGIRDDKLSTHEALVLPYSSISDIDPTRAIMLDGRDIFMFFRAGCSDDPDRSAGIIMRAEFIRAVSATGASDIDAACACSVCPGHISHADSQARMRRARFCPVLPGDTQASARLTEVVLAGCLPVFVGPPWHTMPLPDEADYRAFGTFINVSDTSPYVRVTNNKTGTTNMMSWTVNPEIDVSDIAINVESLHHVEAALRAIPTAELEAKVTALVAARPLFWYPDMPGAGHSMLGDVVINHLCVHGKRATRLDRLGANALTRASSHSPPAPLQGLAGARANSAKSRREGGD